MDRSKFIEFVCKNSSKFDEKHILCVNQDTYDSLDLNRNKENWSDKYGIFID